MKRPFRLAALGLIAAVLLSFVFMPSAPVRAAGNLIVNGDFETGDFTGWTTAYSGLDPLNDWTVSSGYTCDWFCMDPPSGYFAWNGFDGDGPSEFHLYQDVTIPAGIEATLSFTYRFIWDFGFEGVGLDALPRHLIVQVRDPLTNAVLATLYSTSTWPTTQSLYGDTGWVTITSDVSAFAGSTIRVFFLEIIPEFFTGPAMIGFDNIALMEGAPVGVCDVGDGSINATHCGRPVAVYTGSLEVWGIDVNTGMGVLAFEVTDEQIEAVGVPEAAPVVLAQGVNPFTFWPITVYRLPTGEFQLNTYYWDGKPYVIIWETGADDLYVVEW